MTTEFPPAPDLEFLRKHAKELLRCARGRDAEALRRIRAALPGTAAAADAELAATLKLADVQQALAREAGFSSWAQLRRAVEERQPLAARAEQLLSALYAGDRSRVLRLVAAHADLAEAGIACAAALGDAGAVAAALATDSALATETDARSATPLLYACASPLPAADPARARDVTRCVELLLDHGADPNTYTLFDAADPRSRIPALFHACVANQPEVVRLLLERGADPNDGESLYHAAELDRRECLELLLAHGAEISNPHGGWGNTPLYFLTGYDEAVVAPGMRWLLEHGADPNIPSQPHAETPLHRVAEHHGPEIAELLLAHGADPHRPRGDGRTPYVLALRSGNQPVAELFLQRGADASQVGPVDAFLGACLHADEAAARDLLARHPRLLDELGADERAALGWAVQRDREASVRLLTALGFDLSWAGTDGGTPLHQAAWRGNPRMVRLLVELDAPLDVRDAQFGVSPLGWAAHGSANCRRADDDYCEVVETLLDNGASYDAAVNQWGEPPEALASRRVATFIKRRTAEASA